MTNHLDGNAIAGDLYAVFGKEMTTATGTCASCGARSDVAELTVYLSGPGTVARCPHCDSVLLVLVEIRGITCVDVMGFAALDYDEHHPTAQNNDREGTP